MALLNRVQAYYPTVTLWNRLEGRPRSENFERAVKAQVRDALWMLSKQWQMGEFIGDDAGSPVLAKAHMETTRLTKYKGGSADAEALEQEIPLEVKVEHQAIAFKQGNTEISLDIRLLMGRQWLKWATAIDPAYRQAYIDKYGIRNNVQPDPDAEADATICAHRKVWQQFAAVTGRRMDGYRLYVYLKENATPAHKASDGITLANTQTKKDVLDGLGAKFIAWYEKLYYQPNEVRKNESWKPNYLEHQFAVSAPQKGKEKVLTAEEYYHGHLDWYNLDIDQGDDELETGTPPQDVEDKITHAFVPTSVTFGGMPHPRWWTFENWKTNLGFVNPDTTDLNKLLLLDFFLTYSNDWFIVPFTLPVGSLAKIRGLTVTNVFNEKIWVEAAGRGDDENWQRWNMFNLNVKGTDHVPADLGAVVLPTSRKVQEGKPLEEIFLLRDEIANMVWGVESVVPLPTGKGHRGKEVGYELKAKLQQLIGDVVPPDTLTDNLAKIRFRVVNSVPENWIPFMPVHIDGQKRQIQLQRAAMPRILENDDRVPKKVEPKTSLLRHGLEKSPKETYRLNENEVGRSGTRIKKNFQRTRWHNGEVYNWVGIKKENGRGEGSSGLAFDQLIPNKNRLADDG
ncbi:hypothetical protein SAMN06265379_10198 [Saccharicrinis carchari]|uniref:Uncharacterized protein n=1 Tax=Saccharicrinis carchari TaxID=1168039 RepID=A0A521AEU5_SACCC|nr:hypothetical protein [Saccharicrinis carchari]SMO33323.1 hypothetical protein SAMN06265379_10198 [Saccharicrinis carchari]